MAELIPSHVQKVFARVYHESRTITLTQFIVVVESHAGHGGGAELSATSAAVAKAVAVDTRGKTLLERMEPILSNLEKIFVNNLNTVVAEAKKWRKIEAIIQSSTSTPPSRQQDSNSRQHSSKSAGSSAKWECHPCGQRGHIARNCMAPSPVTSGGEQGHSSAARQQRLPNKGNNRGHRGPGGGGSFEGSGSSRSTFAQQKHQASKTNPGSSGSGSVERLHNGLYRWTRDPPLLRRRRCRAQQRRARRLPLHPG